MDGIFIAGRRPKSKKEIKEADPQDIVIEGTSLYDHSYAGPVLDMPDGKVNFVGPDPYTKRTFYGTLTKVGGKVTVK